MNCKPQSLEYFGNAIKLLAIVLLLISSFVVLFYCLKSNNDILFWGGIIALCVFVIITY